MSMTTAPSMEFSADRVKRIRVQLGISQADFAQKLGVDSNIVNRWEKGKSTPTHARVLKALLDAEREAFGG